MINGSMNIAIPASNILRSQFKRMVSVIFFFLPPN